MPEMPEDDAVIVHDEMTEEQAREDLVAKVAKIVEPEETPAEEAEIPGEKPEEPAEGEIEVPEFTDELKSRAKQAGLSEDVAQQLHQSGQLREIITAFNTKLVEYVQSKEESKDEGQREQAPPPKDQEMPALDPDVYDEAIIKRDAWQTKRIDALEAQLQELLQERQQGGPEFDQWVDESITKLGGNPKDEEDCQRVFRVYGNLCQAFGIDPAKQVFDVMDQAYDVVHPEKLARKTVNRLRDSQGKFMSPTPSKSAGAPPLKPQTDEERHEALVARVRAYGKEQGIQWSGY